MKKVTLLLFVVSFLIELYPVRRTHPLISRDSEKNPVQVCTFNGKGRDVIHEVVVASGSTIRITLPDNEVIKKVLCDRKILDVTGIPVEVIVKPKQENLSVFLTVLSGDNHAYIFRIKIEAVKIGDKSPPIDQHIFIRR